MVLKIKRVGAKAGANVGARKTDKQQKRSDALGYHTHLFISGTAIRKTRLGQNRGRMPAHLPSFITTAAAASESAVSSTLTSALIDGIARAIERIG